jgi:hypothetical protein
MRIATSMLVLFVAATCLVSPEAHSSQVFDAKSQFLGELMDIHPNGDRGFPNAIVKLFVLKMGRSVMIDSVTGTPTAANAALWFTAIGCAGTPYVDSSLFYTVAPLGRIFVTASDKAPGKIIALSVERALGGGLQRCETLSVPLPLAAVPAERLFQLPFQAPVALPLVFVE